VGYLAIHHSGVNVDSTALSIAEYHVNVMGWAEGIGYHWLVHWDGRIEYVGDILTARANVAKRNREVVGICVIGDLTSSQPTPLALTATVRLSAYLKQLIPGAVVVGHREITVAGWETTCPGNTFLGGWKAAVA
jgi:N-acetylmuramoyl-L-alanine amidase